MWWYSHTITALEVSIGCRPVSIRNAMRCMAHYFSTIIGPSACAFNALHSALPRSQLQQSKPKMIVTIVWASEWILRLQLQLFSLTASCRCKGIRRNLASGCPHMSALKRRNVKGRGRGNGEWGMRGTRDRPVASINYCTLEWTPSPMVVLLFPSVRVLKAKSKLNMTIKKERGLKSKQRRGIGRSRNQRSCGWRIEIDIEPSEAGASRGSGLPRGKSRGEATTIDLDLVALLLLLPRRRHVFELVAVGAWAWLLDSILVGCWLLIVGAGCLVVGSWPAPWIPISIAAIHRGYQCTAEKYCGHDQLVYYVKWRLLIYLNGI